MAITFDGATRRIILDSADVAAAEIWSRWVDWHENNAQWPLAFSLVGGQALGGGLFIPPYFFLLNSWRVRPMEQAHNLTITGNLFVDGGGVPIVSTLGTYQVNVNYTVPVQAQGIATSGSSGPTASEIANAVWLHLIESNFSAEQFLRVMTAALAGLLSGAGSTTVRVRDLSNTRDRIVATVDEQGNRSAVTLDLG